MEAKAGTAGFRRYQQRMQSRKALAPRVSRGSLSRTEIVGDGARASIVRAHGHAEGPGRASAQIFGAQS
jgi:hypothetical protein